MNKKPKLPDFDRSVFKIDATLDNRINILITNPDFQENHKKLRGIMRKVLHEQVI
jgi:predicted component of type VI protein secretion system